jgi:hypothetical protein
MTSACAGPIWDFDPFKFNVQKFKAGSEVVKRLTWNLELRGARCPLLRLVRFPDNKGF